MMIYKQWISSRLNTLVASVIVLTMLLTAVPANLILASSTNEVVFNYTGGVQQWVVPDGVYSIDVDIRGAQGGTSAVYYQFPGGPGGPGGRVQTTLSVTPGETLYLYVGGAGSARTGGYNGGGNGGWGGWGGTCPGYPGGGGGGGASDIRQGGNNLSNRVVVAGGGGGGKGYYDSAVDGPYGGGLGGNLTGGDGPDYAPAGAYGGKGGTQSSGGAGYPYPGSLGFGGEGQTYDWCGVGGGGGGGGYYGGGGGAKDSAGGGGGSSYSTGMNTIHTQGYQLGDGLAIITYSMCVATATSTGMACFTTSNGTIEDLTAVAAASGAPVEFPHGMFSFNITGLIPGQNVTITIDLPGPMPLGTQWWKYQAGSWYSLPIGDDDGDNIITITLTDGVFPGDSDKTEDSTITDPGGPGYVLLPPAPAPVFCPCELDISSTEGGSVITPGEGTFYNVCTWVNLVARPDDGYKFVNWSGDVATIADVHDASTTISMRDWYYSITANFAPEEDPPAEPLVQYELSVSSTMGGSVTTPGEGLFNYDAGTIVSLVAEPAFGYKFVNWTGDSITHPNFAITTVTMNGDYSIEANFGFEETTSDSAEGSSGQLACFIATAAYGTPIAEEIQILREFRDKYLLTSPMGQALVALYYKVSPPIAKFITEHPSLKPLVRAGLLPAVAMSNVAVNTSPAEKAATIGLVALLSVALATWATKRRGRGPEYS